MRALVPPGMKPLCSVVRVLVPLVMPTSCKLRCEVSCPLVQAVVQIFAQALVSLRACVVRAITRAPLRWLYEPCCLLVRALVQEPCEGWCEPWWEISCPLVRALT